MDQVVYNLYQVKCHEEQLLKRVHFYPYVSKRWTRWPSEVDA